MSEEKTIRTTDFKTLFRTNIKNYSMFIMLAVILLVFAPLTKGGNFNPRNFTNIFFQYSYVIVLAVGMVQCIVILGIDLAVGSVCAFVGALSVMVYNATGGNMTVALISALLMGLGIGAWQGVWIAFGKIPAFIVTLAGMMLFRGLTYIVTKISPVSPIKVEGKGYDRLSTGTLDEVLGLKPFIETSDFKLYPAPLVIGALLVAIFIVSEILSRNKKIENDFEVSPESAFWAKIVIISVLVMALAERFAEYRGLPIVLIVVGITVFVFNFILNNTVVGRYIYAVGGNYRSAKLSGINSEVITFVVFCFMGILAGLAAVVSTGYMNTALPQAGKDFEMDAIASCYIGGVSAAGGIGSVTGVVVGALVMCAINNGMVLMNLGTHYQYVVRALILLLAVFYDVYTRNKTGLG
ncbi:MAG: multiple sugar ABC transporter system permease protein [Treponematales bacterium]|jgi:putative multiple sugar transport system permease protein